MLQENNCSGIMFHKISSAGNVTQRMTLLQVFSFEFPEIFRTAFL